MACVLLVHQHPSEGLHPLPLQGGHCLGGRLPCGVGTPHGRS